MTTWTEFVTAAPRIADTFIRRHRAARNLCMLATLRADGFPRISPMEPRIFEDVLWISGMEDTTKYRDLRRDPRLCLHTATVDTEVKDGDAKLFGRAYVVPYGDQHRRFADALFEDIGLDLRGRPFDLIGVDIAGASAVHVSDDHLDITIWKPGQAERVVRKH
ncbi:pyridoxamine 5'-phosphate oxidase family protein [Mycobacterium camsae]|uniref:pyridoxamine 5'-phosphate oxidase family protein n=1 Tax=Mycobacterium gordonae TaxID=1778 RepID=UPI0019820C7D|nr:pyridoxamine 5'-phosphate oxidase family protein [Mycobacterium gordonae]